MRLVDMNTWNSFRQISTTMDLKTLVSYGSTLRLTPPKNKIITPTQNYMRTQLNPCGGSRLGSCPCLLCESGGWGVSTSCLFSGAHEGAECGETSAGTGHAQCFGRVLILVVFQLADLVFLARECVEHLSVFFLKIQELYLASVRHDNFRFFYTGVSNWREAEKAKTERWAY